MERISSFKGRLFINDLTESDFRSQRAPHVLQHFDYDLHRGRNEDGQPDGAVMGDVAITVKLGAGVDADVFLRHLQSQEPGSYTILFNDVIENGRVSSFRNGMVVRGFAYDIREDYTSDGTYLSLHIKPLAVRFLGDNTTVDADVFKQ